MGGTGGALGWRGEAGRGGDGGGGVGMTRMCAGGVSERVVWTVWVCAGGGDGRGGVAIGARCGGWSQVVASHPPPNLPPSRGEG